MSQFSLIVKYTGDSYNYTGQIYSKYKYLYIDIFGKLFGDRYTQDDRYIQGRYIQV